MRLDERSREAKQPQAQKKRLGSATDPRRFFFCGFVGVASWVTAGEVFRPTP
jgi:hypothetical protein